MPSKQICAIWKKTDSKGNPYLSIKISEDAKPGNYSAFANDKSGNDARPDFVALIKDGQEVEDSHGAF